MEGPTKSSDLIFVTVNPLLCRRYIHLWLKNPRTLSNSFYSIAISLLSFRAPILILLTIKSLFSTCYLHLGLENTRILPNSCHPIRISATISLFSYPAFQSSQLLIPEPIVQVTLRCYSMRSVINKWEVGTQWQLRKSINRK